MVANRLSLWVGVALLATGGLARSPTPAVAEAVGAERLAAKTEVALAVPGKEPGIAGQAGRIAGRSGRLVHPLAKIRAKKFIEIIARPLFSTTRRPVPKPKKIVKRRSPALVVRTPDVRLQLIGVIKRGDRAIALVRERAAPVSYYVKRGDVVKGWRVSRIEPRGIALEKAEKNLNLVLPK